MISSNFPLPVQMRHKCIAQIYDAFATDSNDVILIMEMVKGGELFDRIADDSYILTEMAVALIMYQLLEVEYQFSV
jgi:myosin-light-chain kinase